MARNERLEALEDDNFEDMEDVTVVGVAADDGVDAIFTAKAGDGALKRKSSRKKSRKSSKRDEKSRRKDEHKSRKRPRELRSENKVRRFRDILIEEQGSKEVGEHVPTYLSAAM